MGKIQVKALLDSAAPQSFANADLVVEVQEGVQVLEEPLEFLIATGENMAVYGLLIGYTFHDSNVKFSQDFLVTEIPFPVILGADWLARNSVT